MITKKYRRLSKAIKPYGMVIKPCRSGHLGIFMDGRRVYTFAGTPAVIHYAEHNTFHDLKKKGLIPQDDNSV